MSFNSSALLLILSSLFAIVGCAPHRVDLSPMPTMAISYRFSQESGTIAIEEEWWKEFQNEELNGIVASALEGNLALEQSAARIRQAQANRCRVASGPLPELDAEAGFSEREPARNGGSREYFGQLSLAWELDLWKRLSSATNAARFEERAERDDYLALGLLLSAEVSQTYYDIVEQQLLIRLLEEQQESNRTLLGLTELRFDQAGASAVDVIQQKRQLEATQEQVAVALVSLRVAENRLDVLLGQTPDGVDRVESHQFPGAVSIPDTGVPANLLASRPDLRRLQNELVARDYEVAESIAERLPRVGIGAVIGYSEGTVSGDLIRSTVANAVLPLFNWGERKAEVELRSALFEEQLSRYTEAYLVAIEEVENTLYRYRRQLERIDSLEEQRDLAGQQLNEARNRYTKGLTDYLPVLDAVQSLQRAQRDLLSQRRELLGIHILLYRALGGALPES